MLKYYNEFDSVYSRKIYLPFNNEIVDYEIPNCYYINSKGILYNCFGEDGHKEGNLVYAYDFIKDAFYDKKCVSLEDDGKISLQKERIKELETYRRIITTNSITRFDMKKYLHLNFLDLSDPLLIKIITGIISSKIILLDKFIEIENKSSNKRADIEKIMSLSNDDLKDILVRYCGFHKIETIVEKTITTSSLDFNSFSNYFEKGWTVSVVPKLTLCDRDDELYRTMVVDKFLGENPQYDNKILVKKLSLFGKDCNK